MSQTEVTVTRLQQSRKARIAMAKHILSTVEKIRNKKSISISNIYIPFNPISGKEFSGANMIMLMLESIRKGYHDNRWLTREQIEHVQKSQPNLEIDTEHLGPGVKVLRPEEIPYVSLRDGTRKVLSENEYTTLCQRRKAGDAIPQIYYAILFTPYTVYNAANIKGFPDKNEIKPLLLLSDIQKFVSQFVACSGIRVTYMNRNDSHYSELDDTIYISASKMIARNEDYSFTTLLLREFYHASMAGSRECRLVPEYNMNGSIYSMKDADTDLFTVLASAYIGIPQQFHDVAWHFALFKTEAMPEDLEFFFQQASAAGKMLTVMHQFNMGEQPNVPWFSNKNQWDIIYKRQEYAATISIMKDLLKYSYHYFASKPDTQDKAQHIKRVILDGDFDDMKIELFDISHILHNNSTMQWDDGQKRLAQKMLSLWYYLNNNKEIYGEMGIHRQRDTSNEASETVKNPDNAQQRIRMR